MARRTRTSLKGGMIGAHVDDARSRVEQEILVHQVGMALLERLQILLAHGPLGRRAAVELPGAVHGQAGRGVLEDQPFHPIHIRLVL